MKLLEAIMPGVAAKREQARYEAKYYQAACSMIEAIPSFAKDTDEGEWSLTGGGDKMPADYTEYDFNSMRNSARSMYYKNPIARCVVETIVNYAIGKDCTYEAIDEDPMVQEYWDSWSKVNKWDLRSKEFVRRLMRDGEVFLRRFPPKDGVYQLVRFVDPGEIKDPNDINGWGNHTFGIECDADDIETPVNYYRNFREANNSDNWEQIPAEEMIHVKIMVDSDVKRGLSFLIGIAEDMTDYKAWLKYRKILNKIRTMFNLVATPTGSSSTATLKGLFSDTTGKSPTGRTADKKLPRPGSVLLNKGVDWDYKNLNINASDTADDGRAIQLMIAIGTQIPEYIIRGDASNANYASTSVSESPFVKAMESWQDFIEKPFKQIFSEQIAYGIQKNEVPANSHKTITEYNDGKETIRVEKIETVIECNVNFPTLVHRDVEAETKSFAIQDNQKYVSKKTISGKLGYDYEAEKINIDKQDQESQEKMKQYMGYGDKNGEEKKENDDDDANNNKNDD